MIPMDPDSLRTPTSPELPEPTTFEAFKAGVGEGASNTSIGLLDSYLERKGAQPARVLDSQDDLQQTDFYRPGMKWQKGMTVAQAEAASAKYDDEESAYKMSGHPLAAVGGQLVGGALDPLFYIPYADVGAAGIRAAKGAMSLEALEAMKGESLLKGALELPDFEIDSVAKAANASNPVLRGAQIQALNATAASVLEQPLVAARDHAMGRDYDWENAGTSVAAAFLGGGFFGGLGAKLEGLSMDQRTAGISKALEDMGMGRPVDVAPVVKPSSDITQAVRDAIKAGQTPTRDPGMTPEALRATDIMGSKSEAPDDREFLDSFVKDGGESYYRARLDDLDRMQNIPRAQGLTTEGRMAEDQLRAKLVGDLQGAKAEYAAQPETQGGKVLNTDIARELSPMYSASKDTRSRLAQAVHEPASYLVKEMYREKLAEAPKEGEDPMVLFTAGGAGAGKSTAIAGLPGMSKLANRAQIIYDTNMNNYRNSLQKINQALDAGKRVNMVYVARDAVDALKYGTLPRAMRMGRTVVLPEHIKTHVGSADVVQKLAAHFKGDDRVQIRVIDNSGSKGTQRVVPLSFVRKLDYNNLSDRLTAALDQEHASGRISDAVYRGTLGQDAAQGGAARAGEAAREGSGLRDGAPVPGEAQAARGPDGGGPESELDARRAFLAQRLAAVTHPTPDWRSVHPVIPSPEEPDLSGLPLSPQEKAYAAAGDEIKQTAAGMAKAMRAGAACANI